MKRLLLAFVLMAATLWPTAAGAACGWTVVPTPNKGTTFDNFSNGIDYASRTDGWVVGYYWGGTSSSVLFSMHWNGAEWRMRKIPTPTGAAIIADVVALPNGTAWAVGQTYDASKPFRLFWNGQRWRKVRGPRNEPATASLIAVDARGPNDVWVIGGAGGKALVEHWDGTRWRKVKFPDVDTNESLRSVAVVPRSRKVWVSGSFSGSVTQAPLAAMWNGRKWKVSTVPNPAPQASIEALGVVASDDVWGLGYRTGMPYTWGTFATHWDGSAWTTEATPHPSTGFPGEFIYGAAAVGSAKVYGGGSMYVSADTSYDPLVMRWDGASWLDVTPATSAATFEFRDATRIPGTRQVAFVGFQRIDGRFETRVVQGC